MLFIFHVKDQNIKYISLVSSVLNITVTHYSLYSIWIRNFNQTPQFQKVQTSSKQCKDILKYKYKLSVCNEMLMF